MLVGLILPFLIGTLGVLQNTLNRVFATSLGLGSTLLMNGLVLAVCGILFQLGIRSFPSEALPEMYRPLAHPRPFVAYDLVPGIFGFLIIAAMPWAIQRMGATRVFVGVIAAQIIVSMLWDKWVEGISVSVWKVAGAILALAGTALASL